MARAARRAKMKILFRYALAASLLLLPAAASAAPTAAPPTATTLVEARTLYNQGKYDEAITAASAVSSPEMKDGARLVAGRAYLERFRHTGDTIDLSTARNDFRTLDPTRLDAQERVQLLVGLGESLYLDNLYGPAADLFDVALSGISLLGPDERNQVLDWWATALNAEAQRHEIDHRASYYQRILDRMRDVQRADPRSTTAAYWIVAAERGLGQLDQAWSDAIAYWVRAPLMDHGDGLRTDLDQLVVLGIIPDRSRELAPAPDDAATTAADLRAEWEVVKQKWGS